MSKLSTPKPAPAPAKRPNPEHPRCRILLVDDHPITRHGMKILLERGQRFEVCGEADSAPRALELVGKLSPDVAIVDITLKSTDGIELTKDIRVLAPAVQVLVISMHEEDVYAERAVRAGAMGYLMKDEAADKMVGALDRILQGELYLSERIKGKMLQRLVHPRAGGPVSPIDKLSDREVEVLRLIGKGYGTREIASLLNLSVKTIDTYREHLKAKLEFPTSGDLTRFAIQWMKNQPA